MMVETSALCAILLREPGYEALVRRIEASEKPFTSAVVQVEAMMGVTRELNVPPVIAMQLVQQMTDSLGLQIKQFEAPMAALAAEARERFGKGRHVADLNFGDCLSYATARFHRAELLFVGNDFSQTDVNSPPI